MHFISQKRNVFNIQRAEFSDSIILTSHNHKYVLIDSHFDYKILCKVYNLNKNISSVCYVDESVLVFPQTVVLSNTIPIIRHLSEKPRTVPVIWEIDQNVNTCTEVNITLVFQNIRELIKWKVKPDILTLCVKDILKLYVFMSNSIISLDNLRSNQKIHLNSIIINSAVHKNGAVDTMLKIGAQTNIKIVKTMSFDKYKALQNINTIVIPLYGIDEAYRSMQEVVDFSQCHKLCKQILLSGPLGCGKTELVYKLAKESGLILLKILGPDFIQSAPGESEKNLDEIFNLAKMFVSNDEHCLILIDEIDSIASKSKQMSHNSRLLSRLCGLLEDTHNVHGVVVIATSNKSENIDRKLFRHDRLGHEIIINIPSQNERCFMLKNMLKKDYNFTLEDEFVGKMSNWTNGYVGADLSSLVADVAKKVKGKILDRDNLAEEILSIFKQEVSQRTSTIHKSSIGVVTNKSLELKDIGGLTDVKDRLYTSIILPLLKPEPFRKLGVPTPRGVLLYGPPGCAKTTIVKALANATNMTFIAISAAELYSPFVGDAEKKIAQLFNQARLCAPSILFIDEIDAIVGSRWSTADHKVQERVLSTLLVEMDGVGTTITSSTNTTDSSIIIVAATNRPDLLDDALKRPGRFDKILYIRHPDALDRHNILELLTKKMPLDRSVNLNQLADQCELFSGADLKNLCTEVALHALDMSEMKASVITADHFNFVLKNYKPSLTQEQITFYEKL